MATPISLEQFLREQWPSMWFTLNDAVHVNDEQGLFVLVNPAYCKLVGYSEEELVGSSFLELIPKELRQEYAEQYRRASGDVGDVGEFQLVHRSGRRIHVNVRASLLQAGGCRMYAFITRDITERRSLEQQLLHTDRIRALGTLAGGVAHEFNNLLVSILGYAELIGDVDSGAKVHEFAQKIARAAHRGTQITGQLLPFSRKDEFHKEPVNLHDLLREAADLFRLSGDNGSVELDLALGAPNPWVHANAIQLNQVFLNLVINARDAMPDGGSLQVKTSGIAAAHPGSCEVQVQVTDTGCGMDDEVQRRIFEPFFTTKRSGKGTGLGMALVFSTVTSHSGTVEVESAVGRGSTVSVRFPCIDARG